MHLAKLQRAFRLYLRVLRVSTFGAVAAGVVGSLAARSVYASAAESAFELDRQWARDAASLDRSSYRVRLNGQALMISSHMTDDGVHAALQAAEDECRANSARLDGDIAKLPGAALARLTSWVFGVVHREWSDHGYVACIVREHDQGLAGLAKDLGEVARTGDLAGLGTLRYVMAERGAGASKTHVLRQWTAGRFDLKAMFPAQGDAPGADLPEVPRPEGARRVLDASVEGTPFGVRVYDAPGAPGAILTRYEQELVARGWTSVSLPEKDAARMRVFDQGSAQIFIGASRSGDRAVVSVASMPPTPAQ